MPPRHDSGATGPRIAWKIGSASPQAIGITGILRIVLASLTGSFFPPAVEPQPGVSGSPGVDRHVHHAAALHAELGTERPIGIDLALEEAVVLRVGEDQAADGAVFVGHLRLDAAPAAAVARQHDLALHAHAELLELFVVGGHAVVDVHHFARDVTVGRIGVVGRRLVVVGRVGIACDRRLLDEHRAAHRRHHLEAAFERPRHVGLELLDRRLEAERLELREGVLRDLLRAGTAGHVRLLGHRAHVLAQARRIRHGAELVFEGTLGGQTVGREPAQGRRLAGKTHRLELDEGEQDGGEDNRTTHAREVIRPRRATQAPRTARLLFVHERFAPLEHGEARADLRASAGSASACASRAVSTASSNRPADA